MITVKFNFNGYEVSVNAEAAELLEFDVIETRVVLAKLPHGGSGAQQQQQQQRNTESDGLPEKEGVVIKPDDVLFKVSEVRKELGRTGKPFFKFCGGQFDMWGVPMYPDTCLFKDGLNPATIHLDVVSGIEALARRKGNAWRIISVRRAVNNG